MTIIARLGGLGSGKTLTAVWDLIKNNNGLKTYTNITTKNIKNIVKFKPEMIIKRSVLSVSKSGIIKYKYAVNEEYWEKQKKGVNILIDEFHNFSDARKPMHNVTKTINDFVAMIRRVTGESSNNSGTFTIITQLERRIDKVLKELCNLVLYHICYYDVYCNHCNKTYKESSESPERYGFCNNCMSTKITKSNYVIHIYYFQGFQNFYFWYYRREKTYFRIKVLNNMQKYFKYYDTSQWENLFADYY